MTTTITLNNNSNNRYCTVRCNTQNQLTLRTHGRQKVWWHDNKRGSEKGSKQIPHSSATCSPSDNGDVPAPAILLEWIVLRYRYRYGTGPDRLDRVKIVDRTEDLFWTEVESGQGQRLTSVSCWTWHTSVCVMTCVCLLSSKVINDYQLQIPGSLPTPVWTRSPSKQSRADPVFCEGRQWLAGAEWLRQNVWMAVNERDGGRRCEHLLLSGWLRSNRGDEHLNAIALGKVWPFEWTVTGMCCSARFGCGVKAANHLWVRSRQQSGCVAGCVMWFDVIRFDCRWGKEQKCFDYKREESISSPGAISFVLYI